MERLLLLAYLRIGPLVTQPGGPITIGDKMSKEIEVKPGDVVFNELEADEGITMGQTAYEYQILSLEREILFAKAGNLPYKVKMFEDELARLKEKGPEESRGFYPNIEDAVSNGEIKMVRFESDEPRYELFWLKVGGVKPINLDSDEIMSWAITRKHMFNSWKVMPVDLKPKEWHKILGELIATCKEVSEIDASKGAEVLDILEGWFQAFSNNSWRHNDIYRHPLYKGGFYYFRMDVFEQNALFQKDSRFFYQRHLIPRSELYKALKNAGAKSLTVRFRKIPERMWKIAEDFNVPTEEPTEELEEPETDEFGDPKETIKSKDSGQLAMPDKPEEDNLNGSKEEVEKFLKESSENKS